MQTYLLTQVDGVALAHTIPTVTRQAVTGNLEGEQTLGLKLALKKGNTQTPGQKARGVASIAASMNDQACVHNKYNLRLPSASGQKSHLSHGNSNVFPGNFSTWKGVSTKQGTAMGRTVSRRITQL